MVQIFKLDLEVEDGCQVEYLAAIISVSEMNQANLYVGSVRSGTYAGTEMVGRFMS